MATNALERIDENAAAFSRSLLDLSLAIDGNLETVIRLGILKVFAFIVKESPVDTGAYRASHGISNSDPEGRSDIKEGEYSGGGGSRGLAGAGWEEFRGWCWTIKDGTIYFYNNQPYALRLEEGHSGQAPHGIYAMAMAEFNQIFNDEIRKVEGLEPTGGGS
jgi:hypothetical protein